MGTVRALFHQYQWENGHGLPAKALASEGARKHVQFNPARLASCCTRTTARSPA
jgi:hypothetical protein